MLSLPPSVRVFVATEPVDMRKSFDALAALVEHVLNQDPLSGHLFVFVGKRRHLVRILFWDRTGYALFSKRLERGRFHLPERLDSGLGRPSRWRRPTWSCCSRGSISLAPSAASVGR